MMARSETKPGSKASAGPLHTMLTLRLVAKRGDGSAVEQTLAFVELVSPEVKVRLPASSASTAPRKSAACLTVATSVEPAPVV